MNLTTAQLQTIKTDIANNSDLNTKPNNGDGNQAIADLYNVTFSPTFFVWRTNVPIQEIYNQIVFASLTPTDAPDGTLAWECRSLACQGKQLNLQLILQGQSTLNAANTAVRAGLQDALTNVPSGASGALVSAGWVPVRDNALARGATRLEKLFATGDGTHDGTTAAKADTLVVEGKITGLDILAARNS